MIGAFWPLSVFVFSPSYFWKNSKAYKKANIKWPSEEVSAFAAVALRDLVSEEWGTKDDFEVNAKGKSARKKRNEANARRKKEFDGLWDLYVIFKYSAALIDQMLEMLVWANDKMLGIEDTSTTSTVSPE